MRPFGALALEMVTMAVPMVRGPIADDWTTSSTREAKPKAEVLRLWDASTAELDTLWPQIPPARFQETLTAFGQYPGVLHDLIPALQPRPLPNRRGAPPLGRALAARPPPARSAAARVSTWAG
jgi:hypothetical protein